MCRDALNWTKHLICNQETKVHWGFESSLRLQIERVVMRAAEQVIMDNLAKTQILLRELRDVAEKWQRSRMSSVRFQARGSNRL